VLNEALHLRSHDAEHSLAEHARGHEGLVNQCLGLFEERSNFARPLALSKGGVAQIALSFFLGFSQHVLLSPPAVSNTVTVGIAAHTYMFAVRIKDNQLDDRITQIHKNGALRGINHLRAQGGDEVLLNQIYG
jgi:hypothetical protein